MELIKDRIKPVLSVIMNDKVISNSPNVDIKTEIEKFKSYREQHVKKH